jgi:hypothetical protein
MADMRITNILAATSVADIIFGLMELIPERIS